MTTSRLKEFGEGIDRICNELETKGFAIPTFHVDAFILKATLMAEWTSEKEFGQPSSSKEELETPDKLTDKLPDKFTTDNENIMKTVYAVGKNTYSGAYPFTVVNSSVTFVLEFTQIPVQRWQEK